MRLSCELYCLVEKLLAVDCLLESFCSTRTGLNTHATRTAQLVQLYYSEGLLAGAELQMALPDTWRLLKEGRRPGEPTFPILYQVQAALGKSCLFLPPRDLSSNCLFTPLQDERELLTALQDWSRVCVAMEVLGIDQDEEETFWLILAAITDLGVLAQQMEDTGCYDCDPAVAEKVCGILGVTRDSFYRLVSRTSSLSPASSRCSSTQPGGLEASGEGPHVLENIKRLVQNLYSDLLARLVILINRSIQPPAKQLVSILLLDTPGFQNPNMTGGKHSAGLVDLSYNYLQERLQQFFFNSRVERLGEREKGLAKLFVDGKDSSAMLNLLERAGRAEVSVSGTQTLGRRRSRKEARVQQSPPGLLTLLQRATSCPWSDDRTFLQRSLSHWAHSKSAHLEILEMTLHNVMSNISWLGRLIRKEGEDRMVLNHLQGTSPVVYSVLGWRQLSHNMSRTNLAAELLRKSKKYSRII